MKKLEKKKLAMYGKVCDHIIIIFSPFEIWTIQSKGLLMHLASGHLFIPPTDNG